MRLDLFLRVTGVLKQRTEAARLVRSGRVRVGGAVAKPAHSVRAGEILTVETPRGTGEWEVLEVPTGNVSKKARARFVRCLREPTGGEDA